MPSFDRERIDTTLLVGAFVFGIGSILILKNNQVPDWLPVVTSGVIIVAYAVISQTSGRARLEPDQTGDNAYYLGFVLTLTSFAHTLYKIKPNLTASELSGNVISGFGIAVASTIVGVIVRAYFLQYRVDLVAREKEARLQLNDGMRRFHAEIEDAVRGTKYLGIEIRQSLDEHHRQFAISNKQHMQKVFEEISTGFQRLFNESLERNQETNSGLVDSVRKTISNAENEMLDTLNNVSGPLKETNAAFSDSTRSAAEVLRRSLQDTSEATSQVMGELRTNVRRSVDEVLEQNREISTALAESARTAISDTENALSEALSSTSGLLKEANVAINENTRTAVEALKQSLQETSEVTSEVMGALRINVQNSVEEMSSMHTESVKRADLLVQESAKSIPKLIGSLKNEIEEILDEAETTVEKFSEVNGRIHEAVDCLAENLERLNKQILKQIDKNSNSKTWFSWGKW